MRVNLSPAGPQPAFVAWHSAIVEAGDNWVRSAVDVIQAKISHCGGIGGLLRIASYAEVYNVQVAPYNPYGPVVLAVAAHACLCMPNFLILEH